MDRLELGNISINTLNRKEAIQAISNLISKGGSVFTPNVDHVVLAETNENFAQAYNRASITLADGMPIVWASKLLGGSIEERVTGSDLLLPLLKLIWEQDLSVYFLGASSKTLQTSARKIDDICPRIKILGHSSPVISDSVSSSEVKTIMEPIRELKPNVIIVALGAPKQEIFINQALDYCPNSVIIGLGASFDFFAGNVQRAPEWMQTIGLEWCWRLCSEPRRLWKRYLRDLKFPIIVYRQWLKNRKHINMKVSYGNNK